MSTLHISIDAEIAGEYVRDDIIDMLENVLGYMTENVAIASNISEGTK